MFTSYLLHCPMIPTRHGTLKDSMKQVFFVLQRDGTYVDNHYFFQELSKQFNPSEGYPMFYYLVLDSVHSKYVPVRFGVLHFWAIPQAERGQPFSAWLFIFRIKVEITDLQKSATEVLSRGDIYRVVRGMLTRFIWRNNLFSSKLYLEDLGPYKEPEELSKGEIIEKVSFDALMGDQSLPPHQQAQ